jgi:hypothetical protein
VRCDDFFFTTFDGQRLAFNSGEDAVAITDDFGAVNKAAHDTVHQLDANFTVNGYDAYTILVRAGTGQLFNGDPTFFAIDSFTATPAPTSTVSLTLSGAGSLVSGDVFNVSDASSFTSHQIGTPSIELFGGNIVDNLKGISASSTLNRSRRAPAAAFISMTRVLSWGRTSLSLPRRIQAPPSMATPSIRCCKARWAP